MECAVIAIFLHYSVLASFCWMAVEGYSIYRYFVKVIGHQVPGYLWKASIFAWGKLKLYSALGGRGGGRALLVEKASYNN